MRKMTILAILIISVFLVGCAEKEITVAKEDATAATKTAATTTASKTATATKTASTATKTTASSDDTSEEETRDAVVLTDTEGQATSVQKLTDYNARPKTSTEVCNLESPLECSKYIAQDGIVYITVKNQGYGSKINDVTLYLSGESCDPSGSYIETGQIKEFECYVDPLAKFVSGDLAVKYYSPMEDKSFTKTGKIAVKVG
jgi:uncharacterized lipoprotein NlpE involved in copper resistance